MIDGWEKGIAENPFDGISDMRSVNINNIGKTAAVGYNVTTSTLSGATMGIPVARATKFVSGAATAFYIVDDNGRVWESTSKAGTWTYLSSSNTTTSSDRFIGLACWKGFVFKFQGSSIYYWNGATWSASWKTIVGTTPHYALVGQDDAVYFCNDSGVGSILEVAGSTFDPTNSATYTFAAKGTNSNALAIPSTDIAVSLAEIGTSLLVGGSQNAIYPWDRISTSFRYPIFVAEPYMKRMVTANNAVYIFPGNVTSRGRIYITNGSNIDEFYKIPDHLFGYAEPYVEWGDAIWWRNSIVFGFFGLTNAGALISGPSDLWAIDVTTKAFRSVASLPASSGSGNATVLIPDTTNSSTNGYGVMIGVRDGSNSTGAIAYSGTNAGIGSAIIKTDRIPVGTFLQPRTFENIEFKLYEPLQSGESIQVIMITDSTSASLGTCSTVGAISDVFNMTIENSQWVYFQLSMTGNSTTSGCRVKELRLR